MHYYTTFFDDCQEKFSKKYFTKPYSEGLYKII